MVLLLLFACRPGSPAADPAARWQSHEPWGEASGLSFARDAERGWLVDAAGNVRSGPFVRVEPPAGETGRGWVDDTHFQLLRPDGRTLVFDRFAAVEPVDGAERAFAAIAPEKWGLLTRQGLWLVPALSRWHGPAEVAGQARYAFAGGGEVHVVDAAGVAVDVPAALEASCAAEPPRPAPAAGCASVTAWAGTARAHAELVAPGARQVARWYCGGLSVREADGAEVWTLPGVDSAGAHALARACGAPEATTRVRPVPGGAELRLGPDAAPAGTAAP